MPLYQDELISDSGFSKDAIAFIKRIPRGKVVSYGQVAAACGHPRAARVVGGILRALPENTDVPWWRVINNQGEITIRGNWTASKEVQKALLEKDGVVVSESFMVDMIKYRWRT